MNTVSGRGPVQDFSNCFKFLQYMPRFGHMRSHSNPSGLLKEDDILLFYWYWLPPCYCSEWQIDLKIFPLLKEKQKIASLIVEYRLLPHRICVAALFLGTVLLENSEAFRSQDLSRGVCSRGDVGLWPFLYHLLFGQAGCVHVCELGLWNGIIHHGLPTLAVGSPHQKPCLRWGAVEHSLITSGSFYRHRK